MGAEQTNGFLDSYDMLREELGDGHVSVLIVPGQGPQKRVLLKEDLTPAELIQWDDFTKDGDMLHKQEPNFYVIQGTTNLQHIKDISSSDTPDDEKKRLLIQIRIEWQNNPRFTCNRWERLNAISAGALLLAGVTDQVIFTGGKTNLPEWKTPGGGVDLSHKLNATLLSEGELMRNLMIQMFGARLFRKDHPPNDLLEEYALLTKSAPELQYKEYIEARFQHYLTHELSKKVLVETKSVNTLQNFSFTRNAYPDIQNVGILAANFQLRRALAIASLFKTPLERDAEYDVEHVLLKRTEIRGRHSYKAMLKYLSDPYTNPDLMERLKKEQRWITAHTDPEYAVGFNIGYIFDVNDLSIVQEIIDDMKRPDWVEKAREVFAIAGLDFDTCSEEDFVVLAKDVPEKLAFIKNALSVFKKEVAGPTGPREKYVPPAVDELSQADVQFLLPHLNVKEK